MKKIYHYNSVTEPFSTSIIWICWICNLCESVQRIQMAVTEPPWLLLNPLGCYWTPVGPIYIIGVNKNSGQGKGYPNTDQTFRADFSELLFILIWLELIETPSNSRFFVDHSEKLGLSSHGNMVSWSKLYFRGVAKPCVSTEIQVHCGTLFPLGCNSVFFKFHTPSW